MSVELIAFFVGLLERVPFTHPVITTLDHPLSAEGEERERKKIALFPACGREGRARRVAG
jgi:hypothetical protein